MAVAMQMLHDLVKKTNLVLHYIFQLKRRKKGELERKIVEITLLAVKNALFVHLVRGLFWCVSLRRSV